jgi:glycosyltransferase involved in cell wall biosynthesis
VTPRAGTARILVIGDHWEGSNVTSMANGFAELGAEVHYFDTGFGAPRPALADERLARRLSARRRTRAVEARLVETARRLEPDLTLVYKCEWLGADALHAAHQAGRGVLAHFWPDIPFYDQPSPLVESLREFDLLLTPKSFHVPRLLALAGPDVVYLPYASDPRVHRAVDVRPADRERYGATVGFVGTWRDYREREVEPLARHGLVIYGGYWVEQCRSPQLRSVVHGPVFGLEMSRVFASSRLALNLFTRHGGVSDLHTSRSFEAPACGSPTLMPRTDEHAGFFADDEVVYYADASALAATVDAALADPAALAQIGRRGAERVRAQHLYRHRMAALLDLLGLARAPGLAWPALASSRR